MTLPSAYLGLLVASLIGFGFHALRGGTLGRLLLYLGTAWVSLFLGHFVAEWSGWQAGRLGSLNLLPGVLAALLGVITASVLAGPRGRPPSRGG